MSNRECFECAQLPTGQRPATQRPIDARSGPRSPRCHTHTEALRKRQRQARREYHQRTRYQLEPGDLAELEAFQGNRCPCGNRVKHTDHDHEIAREQCDHPPDRGCKRCLRGLTCHSCNSDILGRGYNQTRLLALVAYLDNPPARQLWGDSNAHRDL